MPVRFTLSRRKGLNLQTISQAVNGLPAQAVAKPNPWVSREFPETDRGPWLTQTEARRKNVKGQRPVLDRFCALSGT